MATNMRSLFKEGVSFDVHWLKDLDGVRTGPLKWSFISADDVVYIGKADDADKDFDDMTEDDYFAGLKRIPDNEVFPALPTDGAITVAPEHLDKKTAFIKRPKFGRYSYRATSYDLRAHLWEEVLVLEKVSRRPHPYIVRYLGCRVRRGYITGIALEALEWTVLEYASAMPDKFAQIDKDNFLAGVESAVRYLHSLGLAHNDISPDNIMIRQADDGSCFPVLIDFGSSGLAGAKLRTGGSAGFCEKDDPDVFVSRMWHDDYSLGRVRAWWDDALKTKQEESGEKADVEGRPAEDQN